MKRILKCIAAIAIAALLLFAGLSINGGNGLLPMLLGIVSGFVGMSALLELCSALFALRSKA